MTVSLSARQTTVEDDRPLGWLLTRLPHRVEECALRSAFPQNNMLAAMPPNVKQLWPLLMYKRERFAEMTFKIIQGCWWWRYSTEHTWLPIICLYLWYLVACCYRDFTTYWRIKKLQDRKWPWIILHFEYTYRGPDPSLSQCYSGTHVLPSCFWYQERQRQTASWWLWDRRCNCRWSPLLTSFAMRMFRWTVSVSCSTWLASGQNRCLASPRVTCENGTVTGK